MPLFKKQEQRTEQTPKALQKRVQVLEQKLEETNNKLQELENQAHQSLTKIGVVRFNPFKEIGGDQSFCVALLDKADNGLIITSYYGRELNRIYAKEVKEGKAKYDLSSEEKKAIDQAIGLENPKHKARNPKRV